MQFLQKHRTQRNPLPIKISIRSSRKKLIILLITTIVCQITCIDKITLTTDNETYTMYQNGYYYDEFISYHSLFSCSLNDLYTYTQTEQDFQDDTPYFIDLYGISKQTSFQVSTEYGVISPVINPTSCNSDCTIQVRNHCQYVGYFHYFDTIEFKIPGLSIITFNVLCNQNFGMNTFQAGEFIIVVIALLIIVLGSIYSRAWTFHKYGINFSYNYIGVYCSFLCIGGTLLLTVPDVASIMADVIVWIVGMAGISICFDQMLFMTRFQIFSKALFSIKRFRSIRVMDCLSFVISLAWMLGWILSDRNWIITDMVSIMIIVAGIKVLKFTSLKKALVMLLLTMSIDIIFLILIDRLQSYSYDQFMLNHLNNPFEIQVPTINPVFGLKCSWVPVSAILYPGMLLSYFRRFDNSRNTNIYIITGSMLFIVGSVLFQVISVFSPTVLPFGLIAEPAMIGLVCLFAYNRKQLRILWNGKFYDPEFMNKEQDFEIEMQHIDQSSHSGKENITLNEAMMQGLTINHDQDSSIQQVDYSEIERERKRSQNDRIVQDTIQEQQNETDRRTVCKNNGAKDFSS